MKKFGLLALFFATVAVAATTYTTNYQLAKPGDGDKNYGELLRDNFDTIDTQMKVNADSVTAHLADTVDAHDATAISATPGAFVCTLSTTVQAYLDCLDGILDPGVSGIVLIAGAQSITGAKTFEAVTTFEANVTLESTLTTPILSAAVLGTNGSGVVEATTFSAIDPLTTTGDLLAYNGGSVRLPVGTDTQVLMADSAEDTGLIWHSLVKGDVGLGNVDNTSDATKDAAVATLTNKTVASPTVTGTLLLQNPSGAQPELHLSEDPDNGTNVIINKAPATLGADYTLTWPTDDGTSGQVLTSDGSGILSWSTPATLPVDLTTGVTGVLPLANGGTNKNATAVNGGFVWSDADSLEIGAAGTSGQILVSAGAAAPTWTNTIPPLTYFTGGAASMAYVGTNPEVGGASPFLLTNAHKRVQVINPAGAITVELPTTSILAGDTWTVVNRSTNIVSVRSSDDSAIDSLKTGYIVFVALQATPTTAAHWSVTEVKEGGSYSVTWTVTGGGSVGTPTDVAKYLRVNTFVQVIIQSSMTASGTVSTLKFSVPYTIASDVITPCHMSLGGTQAVGRCIITGATATVSVTPNYSTSAWAAGANIVNGNFLYSTL